jgi:hypothetical protein
MSQVLAGPWFVSFSIKVDGADLEGGGFIFKTKATLAV